MGAIRIPDGPDVVGNLDALDSFRLREGAGADRIPMTLTFPETTIQHGSEIAHVGSCLHLIGQVAPT